MGVGAVEERFVCVVGVSLGGMKMKAPFACSMSLCVFFVFFCGGLFALNFAIDRIGQSRPGVQ